MPQLDFTTFIPQLFWLFISLSILYLMLSRIALPRISDVIEERKDTITDDLDEAKALSIEAESVVEDLRVKLEEAKAQSQKNLMTERQKNLEEISLKRNEFEDRNKNFPFDPASIDLLILTHAHIDHSGNVPNLIKQGFSGTCFT